VSPNHPAGKVKRTRPVDAGSLDARLGAGPVAGRFDDSGDLLTRDERQGMPREAAAEEPDVP